MGNDVKRYSVVLHVANDSPFRQTGDSCTRPQRNDVVLAADYAALEAERNELQRRLDAADEWATLASEQLKERDALAAELQAARGLLERITTACTLDAYGSSLHDARAFLAAAPPAAQDVPGLLEALELGLQALNVAVSVYDVQLADRARKGLRQQIAAHRQAQQQDS